MKSKSIEFCCLLFQAQIKISVSGEETLKKIRQVSKESMQPNTQVKFYHAERRSKSNNMSGAGKN